MQQQSPATQSIHPPAEALRSWGTWRLACSMLASNRPLRCAVWPLVPNSNVLAAVTAGQQHGVCSALWHSWHALVVASAVHVTSACTHNSRSAHPCSEHNGCYTRKHHCTVVRVLYSSCSIKLSDIPVCSGTAVSWRPLDSSACKLQLRAAVHRASRPPGLCM
jgi:hypothetical protein